MVGLANQYVGFHSVDWTSAICVEGDPYNPDADIRLNWYLPALRRDAVQDRDFICDPTAPRRLIFSNRLCEAIRTTGLTGLIFKTVQLV